MLAAPYQTQSAPEHRMLAPWPAAPAGPRAAALLPRAVDAWFADHFAWRGPLVEASFLAQTRAGLKSGAGQQVIRGKDDWLLLYSGLLGVTGGEVRPDVARRYAAFVCQLQAETRARGARFLFAPAPSTAEIYPGSPARLDSEGDAYPARPRLAGRAGLRGADARPAASSDRGQAGAEALPAPRQHWTNAGALVAFDGIAAALGQPWSIDAASLGWRPGKPVDSDLVRLGGAFGLPPELTPEPPQGPDAAPGKGLDKDLEISPYPPPFFQPAPTAHPVILVIGDSYAADFMGQYFRRAGVSWAWSHQAECRFDRRIFDRVKPDFVVLAPASRLESCR
ncbi:MAG: hypothetical protein WDN45_18835 [Caulobacteraceae bacterium]